MKLIKEDLVNNLFYNDFSIDFCLLGQLTFDQDILDQMENEKLNDTNLFRSNSGQIKKSI